MKLAKIDALRICISRITIAKIYVIMNCIDEDAAVYKRTMNIVNAPHSDTPLEPLELD